MSAERIVYAEMSGRAGGSNVSLRTLLGGLDRARYTPVVVLGDRGSCGDWTGEIHELKLAGLDNFDFFPAGLNVRWWYQFARFILHFPVDLLRTRRLLKRLRPAIVHVNVGQAVAFGVAAKIMNIPVVWHIRELVTRNALGKLQDRVYAACSTRVVATSRAVADRLVACTPKLVVIPNGVADPVVAAERLESFSRRWRIEPADFVVLLLANSVTPSKGFLFLADVADLLSGESGIKFLLAGRNVDPPAGTLHRLFRSLYRRAHGGMGEREKIMSRWASHVAAGRAAFTGYVDASIAIACSSIVVCPNLIPEPFGRSVIEANVQWKPVIAAELPAFDELIADGESGWLLPASPERWASLIGELRRDRERVRRAGVAAKERSVRYSASNHTQLIMTLYDSVTGCE